MSAAHLTCDCATNYDYERGPRGQPTRGRGETIDSSRWGRKKNEQLGSCCAGPFKLSAIVLATLRSPAARRRQREWDQQQVSTTYSSKSVSRDESRNPFANGFESILSFVICLFETFRFVCMPHKQRIGEKLVSLSWPRNSWNRWRHLGANICPANTHTVVLVGRDGREDGLAEDEGLVGGLLELADGRVGQLLLALLAAPLDQVDPRLVLVHRVEDDLCGGVARVSRWSVAGGDRWSC